MSVYLKLAEKAFSEARDNYSDGSFSSKGSIEGTAPAVVL